MTGFGRDRFIFLLMPLSDVEKSARSPPSFVEAYLPEAGPEGLARTETQMVGPFSRAVSCRHL